MSIRSNGHFDMGEPGVQTKWPSDYRTSCSTVLSYSCTGEKYDTTSKKMSSLLTLSPINKQPTARALHFYICQELLRFNGRTIRSYCCSVSALLTGCWWRFLFFPYTFPALMKKPERTPAHCAVGGMVGCPFWWTVWGALAGINQVPCRVPIQWRTHDKVST